MRRSTRGCEESLWNTGPETAVPETAPPAAYQLLGWAIRRPAERPVGARPYGERAERVLRMAARTTANES